MRNELRVQYRGLFGDWLTFADYPRHELKFARNITRRHQQGKVLGASWRLLRKRKVILKAAP